MSTSDTTPGATPEPAAPQAGGGGLIRSPRRLWARIAAIALGAVAAALVWVVADPIAGVTISALGPDGELQQIELAPVLLAAVLQSAVGWGVLALLERFLARARTIWLVLAALVLVGSGVNAGIAAEDLSSGIVLNVMHLAVAAVVVPVLARTSPRR